MSNYTAWEVNYKHFYRLKTIGNKIKFLTNYAVLAPSTHNTQPWKFFIDSNTVIISKENKRTLPKSDPRNEFLSISLGAAAENLLVAADFFGFTSKTKYSQSKNEVEIKLKLKKSANKTYNKHLISQITKRFTDRKSYKSKIIPTRVANILKKTSDKNHYLVIVTDENKKRELRNLSLEALIASGSKKGFREELADLLLPNNSKSGMGMTGQVLQVPGLLAILFPLLPRLGFYPNLSKIMAKKDEKLLINSPAYGILLSSNSDKEKWFEGGRSLERIWLNASKNNLSLQPMASVIILSEHREKLKKLLNTKKTPIMFFRIGYGNKPLHSPRLQAHTLYN